jgi:hypothetical protein
LINYSEHIKGKIVFDPPDLTRKHENHSEWKKHVIAFIDEPDFCSYFSWFIIKRYSLKILPPIRDAHLTIVNDKLSDGIDSTELKYSRSKRIFNERMIDIYYNLDPRTDGKYWWFRAKSNDAIMIRKHIGLRPDPYFNFHITIGRVDGREHEIEHGKYIHEIIKRYGR